MKKCRRYTVARATSILPKPDTTVRPAHALARIEDHLDHVFAPLVDELPYPRRAELRIELRSRLQSVAAEYMSVGLNVDQAVEKAIQAVDHLIPERVVVRRRGNWLARIFFGDSSVPIPSSRHATYSAFGWFGLATILLFMQNQPYGYLDVNFWTMLGFPLLAGFGTSLRSSYKPVLGTLYATLLLIPVVFVLQGMMAPRAADMTAMLYLTMWVPFGCLGAFIGARLRPRILSMLSRHAGEVAASR